MHQVGINKGSGTNRLSFWKGCIMWYFLFRSSIDGMHPIMGFRLFSKDGFMVGNSGTESDGTVRVFLEVAHNAFGSVKVASKWGSTVSAKGHHSICDVKATEGYGPLQSTNETLVLGNVIRATRVRFIQLGMIAMWKW